MTDNKPVDSLQQRAQQLPHSLEPSARLWSQVEAQLTDRAESAATGLQPSRHLWPIAALTLLGVALASLVFQSVSPQPGIAAGSPETTLTAQGPQLEQELKQELEQEPGLMPVVTQMPTQVRQLLDAQLADLPDEARATVIENLEIIASAREEIRQALEKNPNSTLLHSLYLNSYANERTLLKDVEAMARQSKRRTTL